MLKDQHKIKLAIVSSDRPRGIWVQKEHAQKVMEFLLSQRRFHVQPKGWIVERSFAWIGKQRRLNKDYELLPEISESYLYLPCLFPF